MINESNLSFFELVDIDDIQYEGYKNVVDITVDGDESFVLSNGIISHNSAISLFSSVRDPEIHGGLPLRGKILNVNGETIKSVLDSQIMVDMMNSIGLTIGERANRYKLRYSTVWIATDMDVDGMSISALLVNFFYTFWPELFDPAQKPFFNLFMTPFIIASKGKERKYWYGDNYKEFDPNVYNKKNGWEITRAKGLGSLNEEDWSYSIKSPSLIPLFDDGKLKDALELIFGPDADARKDWIGM